MPSAENDPVFGTSSSVLGRHWGGRYEKEVPNFDEEAGMPEARKDVVSCELWVR